MPLRLGVHSKLDGFPCSFLLRGKFGVVKKCKHRQTGVEYAAKFIHKRRGNRGRGLKFEDIKREIDIMADLMPHNRLVQLAGAYDQDKEVVMVMEL